MEKTYLWRNKPVFKVIAVMVAVVFMFTSLGIEKADALAPNLRLASDSFSDPYLAIYAAQKAGKIMGLLEDAGSLSFASVEDLAGREVFLKKDITELEFAHSDGEIIIDIAEGMILRIYDPERKPLSPENTSHAKALDFDQKINKNLAVEILYKDDFFADHVDASGDADKDLGPGAISSGKKKKFYEYYPETDIYLERLQEAMERIKKSPIFRQGSFTVEDFVATCPSSLWTNRSGNGRSIKRNALLILKTLVVREVLDTAIVGGKEVFSLTNRETLLDELDEVSRELQAREEAHKWPRSKKAREQKEELLGDMIEDAMVAIDGETVEDITLESGHYLAANEAGEEIIVEMDGEERTSHFGKAASSFEEELSDQVREEKEAIFRNALERAVDATGNADKDMGPGSSEEEWGHDPYGFLHLRTMEAVMLLIKETPELNQQSFSLKEFMHICALAQGRSAYWAARLTPFRARKAVMTLASSGVLTVSKEGDQEKFTLSTMEHLLDEMEVVADELYTQDSLHHGTGDIQTDTDIMMKDEKLGRKKGQRGTTTVGTLIVMLVTAILLLLAPVVRGSEIMKGTKASRTTQEEVRLVEEYDDNWHLIAVYDSEEAKAEGRARETYEYFSSGNLHFKREYLEIAPDAPLSMHYNFYNEYEYEEYVDAYTGELSVRVFKESESKPSPSVPLVTVFYEYHGQTDKVAEKTILFWGDQKRVETYDVRGVLVSAVTTKMGVLAEETEYFFTGNIRIKREYTGNPEAPADLYNESYTEYIYEEYLDLEAKETLSRLAEENSHVPQPSWPSSDVFYEYHEGTSKVSKKTERNSHDTDHAYYFDAEGKLTKSEDLQGNSKLRTTAYLTVYLNMPNEDLWPSGKYAAELVTDENGRLVSAIARTNDESAVLAADAVVNEEGDITAWNVYAHQEDGSYYKYEYTFKNELKKIYAYTENDVLFAEALIDESGDIAEYAFFEYREDGNIIKNVFDKDNNAKGSYLLNDKWEYVEDLKPRTLVQKKPFSFRNEKERGSVSSGLLAIMGTAVLGTLSAASDPSFSVPVLLLGAVLFASFVFTRKLAGRASAAFAMLAVMLAVGFAPVSAGDNISNDIYQVEKTRRTTTAYDEEGNVLDIAVEESFVAKVNSESQSYTAIWDPSEGNLRIGGYWGTSPSANFTYIFDINTKILQKSRTPYTLEMEEVLPSDELYSSVYAAMMRAFENAIKLCDEGLEPSQGTRKNFEDGHEMLVANEIIKAKVELNGKYYRLENNKATGELELNGTDVTVEPIHSFRFIFETDTKIIKTPAISTSHVLRYIHPEDEDYPEYLGYMRGEMENAIRMCDEGVEPTEGSKEDFEEGLKILTSNEIVRSKVASDKESYTLVNDGVAQTLAMYGYWGTNPSAGFSFIYDLNTKSIKHPKTPYIDEMVEVLPTDEDYEAIKTTMEKAFNRAIELCNDGIEPSEGGKEDFEEGLSLIAKGKEEITWYKDTGLLESKTYRIADAYGNLYYHYTNKAVNDNDTQDDPSDDYGLVDVQVLASEDEDGSIAYTYEYYEESRDVKVKRCYLSADHSDPSDPKVSGINRIYHYGEGAEGLIKTDEFTYNEDGSLSNHKIYVVAPWNTWLYINETWTERDGKVILTTTEYNEDGNIVKITEEEDGVETLIGWGEYYPDGRVKRLVDENGNVSEYCLTGSHDVEHLMTLYYNAATEEYKTFDWTVDDVAESVYKGKYVVKEGDVLGAGVVAFEKQESYEYIHHGEMVDLDTATNGWTIAMKKVFVLDASSQKLICAEEYGYYAGEVNTPRYAIFHEPDENGNIFYSFIQEDIDDSGCGRVNVSIRKTHDENGSIAFKHIYKSPEDIERITELVSYDKAAIKDAGQYYLESWNRYYRFYDDENNRMKLALEPGDDGSAYQYRNDEENTLEYEWAVHDGKVSRKAMGDFHLKHFTQLENGVDVVDWEIDAVKRRMYLYEEYQSYLDEDGVEQYSPRYMTTYSLKRKTNDEWRSRGTIEYDPGWERIGKAKGIHPKFVTRALPPKPVVNVYYDNGQGNLYRQVEWHGDEKEYTPEGILAYKWTKDLDAGSEKLQKKWNNHNVVISYDAEGRPVYIANPHKKQLYQYRYFDDVDALEYEDYYKKKKNTETYYYKNTTIFNEEGKKIGKTRKPEKAGYPDAEMDDVREYPAGLGSWSMYKTDAAKEAKKRSGEEGFASVGMVAMLAGGALAAVTVAANPSLIMPVLAAGALFAAPIVIQKMISKGMKLVVLALLIAAALSVPADVKASEDMDKGIAIESISPDKAKREVYKTEDYRILVGKKRVVIRRKKMLMKLFLTDRKRRPMYSIRDQYRGVGHIVVKPGDYFYEEVVSRFLLHLRLAIDDTEIVAEKEELQALYEDIKEKLERAIEEPPLDPIVNETGWLSNPDTSSTDPRFEITASENILAIRMDTFSYRRPFRVEIDKKKRLKVWAFASPAYAVRKIKKRTQEYRERMDAIVQALEIGLTWKVASEEDPKGISQKDHLIIQKYYNRLTGGPEVDIDPDMGDETGWIENPNVDSAWDLQGLSLTEDGSAVELKVSPAVKSLNTYRIQADGVIYKETVYTPLEEITPEDEGYGDLIANEIVAPMEEALTWPNVSDKNKELLQRYIDKYSYLAGHSTGWIENPYVDDAWDLQGLSVTEYGDTVEVKVAPFVKYLNTYRIEADGVIYKETVHYPLEKITPEDEGYEDLIANEIVAPMKEALTWPDVSDENKELLQRYIDEFSGHSTGWIENPDIDDAWDLHGLSLTEYGDTVEVKVAPFVKYLNTYRIKADGVIYKETVHYPLEKITPEDEGYEDLIANEIVAPMKEALTWPDVSDENKELLQRYIDKYSDSETEDKTDLNDLGKMRKSRFTLVGPLMATGGAAVLASVLPMIIDVKTLGVIAAVTLTVSAAAVFYKGVVAIVKSSKLLKTGDVEGYNMIEDADLGSRVAAAGSSPGPGSSPGSGVSPVGPMNDEDNVDLADGSGDAQMQIQPFMRGFDADDKDDEDDEENITKITDGSRQGVLDKFEENKLLYEGLPDDEKLSIDQIIKHAAEIARLAEFDAKDTAKEFYKGTGSYITDSKEIITDMLEDTDTPILLRVPIEALENDENKGIAEWLQSLAGTKAIVIELYTVQSPESDLSVDVTIYERYGLEVSSFPEEMRVRANVISLFTAEKQQRQEAKRAVSNALTMSPKLKESIIVPMGIKGDPTGVIRATLFGLRLVKIARGQSDEAFVQDTINRYESLVNTYHRQSLKLTVEEVMAIATGSSTINAIANTLAKIIETLPIEKFSAEELRELYESALSVAQAA